MVAPRQRSQTAASAFGGSITSVPFPAVSRSRVRTSTRGWLLPIVAHVMLVDAGRVGLQQQRHNATAALTERALKWSKLATKEAYSVAWQACTNTKLEKRTQRILAPPRFPYFGGQPGRWCHAGVSPALSTGMAHLWPPEPTLASLVQLARLLRAGRGRSSSSCPHSEWAATSRDRPQGSDTAATAGRQPRTRDTLIPDHHRRRLGFERSWSPPPALSSGPAACIVWRWLSRCDGGQSSTPSRRRLRPRPLRVPGHGAFRT